MEYVSKRVWAPWLALLLWIAGSHALAQSVVATVPTPMAPQRVAVDPVTGTAYVFNGMEVTVIDGETHATVGIELVEPLLPMPTPADLTSNTGGIAVDPLANRVYVANALRQVLSVIDVSTRAVTNVGLAGRPTEVAVNPVSGEIYVAHSAGVTIVDGETHAKVTLAAGTDPRAIGVNPLTNKAYIANHGSNTVTVIDGATRSTATVASPGRPIAVAVNPVTNKVYVANLDGSVTVIDGATLATTTLDTTIGTHALAVNPATNKVYVSSHGLTALPPVPGDVVVIDGATNAVTTIGQATPGEIAIDPVTNTVYVKGTGIQVIDGATDTRVRVLAGEVVGGIAANPVTHRIYAASTFEHHVKVIDGAAPTVETIPAGAQPMAVAVNPITNRIYVGSEAGPNVTVIDGATSATASIAVGVWPRWLAVNPVTNRIYVGGAGGLVEIDGETNTATPLPASGDMGVAVNPLTNKIYAASYFTLSEIDGATRVATPVASGETFSALAVNSATNRVYAVEGTDSSRSLVVFDAGSRVTTRMNDTFLSGPIAVDPVRNKVFVLRIMADGIALVDGATHAVQLLPGGSSPLHVAVDPVRGRLYVGSSGAPTVTVVDYGIQRVRTVTLGRAPWGIAFDPVADKLYASILERNEVAVIDGATLATTIVPTGTAPFGVAVNPVTSKVYVANRGGNTVSVITPARAALVHHAAEVTMAGGTVTRLSTPALSLTVCCPYAPHDPPIDTVYFRAADRLGAFAPATGDGPFTAVLAAVQPGLNFVKLFALDAMGASIDAAGASRVGAPKVFAFVALPPIITTTSPLPRGTVGAAYSGSLSAGGGDAPITFAVTGGSLPPGLALSSTGALTGTPTQSGFFAFTVTATDAAGSTARATFALTTAAGDPPRLGNVSTRMQVLTGNDVMIGGFVVVGSSPKTVVVRARGPSLALASIANPLADPVIQLVRSADAATVASNDDWGAADNAAAVAASGFAPANDRESAILATLAPGAYTAIVSGAGGTTGVGIVEVFELDRPELPLVNLSTRGRVLTGEDVMIGGFVVQGDGPQTVVVRARGPTLAPFGITNPLGDPTLRLVRSSDSAILAENDNWITAPNRAAIEASGFAPSHFLEAAILVTLPPGAYTAIVSGAGGTTGVGIVEVFRN